MLFPADLDGNLKFENVRAIDGLIEEQRKKFLKAIEVEHANAVKYMDTAVYLVSSVLKCLYNCSGGGSSISSL